MIKIIDNLAPISLQEDILATLLDSDSFPWHYVNVVSGGVPDEHTVMLNYGFFHNAYLSDQPDKQSKFFKVCLPLIYFLEDKAGVSVKQLIRVRVGMQTIVDTSKNVIHPPHVDYTSPHKTLIYYVNDSDGETILYKEKYSGEKITDFTIDQIVLPKKGSAVLFDGLTYHSSSSPTATNTRLAITINFI